MNSAETSLFSECHAAQCHPRHTHKQWQAQCIALVALTFHQVILMISTACEMQCNATPIQLLLLLLLQILTFSPHFLCAWPSHFGCKHFLCVCHVCKFWSLEGHVGGGILCFLLSQTFLSPHLTVLAKIRSAWRVSWHPTLLLMPTFVSRNSTKVEPQSKLCL